MILRKQDCFSSKNFTNGMTILKGSRLHTCNNAFQTDKKNTTEGKKERVGAQ